MKYKTDIFHRILQGKNMIFVWQVSNSLNENSSVIWQDRVLSKDLPIKPKVRKTRFSSKSLALAKFSLNFRYKLKISFPKPFDVEKQIKSVKSESFLKSESLKRNKIVSYSFSKATTVIFMTYEVK